MRARTFVVSSIVALLLAPMAWVAPGAAASRPPIDPLTLNPPLENGDPVCTWRGGLIVCQSTVVQVYDEVSFGTGIVCGEAEIQQTLIPTLEKGIATYNSAKDIVELEYIESYTGSLTNPDNGRSAAWTQQDRLTYTFATPGDTMTGTATMRAVQQVSEADGRVILTDAGVQEFELPYFVRLESRGHHPLDDWFYAGDASGVGVLCDALG